MTLEHLGIAVADAPAAVALFERLLQRRPYKEETVEREGVRTVFFGDGADRRPPKLELLEALSPDSPVATFLEKRGAGLHHVAFDVDDLDAEMARIRDAGFRLLADAPKPGADGKRIVFLHPKDTAGVLVELVQSAPPEPLDVLFEGGALSAGVSGPADAPPLVVLHAGVPPLLRRIRRDFRLYTLDLPGGTAAPPDGLVSAVLALLDVAGLGRTALFGASGGALAALRAAARHPERFERLALHGMMPEQPLSGADLTRITLPVLLSVADNDPLLDQALYLRRTLPNASLVVVPSSVHPLSGINGELLSQTIGSFLGREQKA